MTGDQPFLAWVEEAPPLLQRGGKHRLQLVVGIDGDETPPGVGMLQCGGEILGIDFLLGGGFDSIANLLRGDAFSQPQQHLIGLGREVLAEADQILDLADGSDRRKQDGRDSEGWGRRSSEYAEKSPAFSPVLQRFPAWVRGHGWEAN